MNKLFLEVIAAAGGSAAIVLVILRVMGNKILDMIVERIKTENSLRADKEKALLQNRIFVTQMHYNKLYNLYEAVCSVYVDAYECVETLIPENGTEAIRKNYPGPFSEKEAYIKEGYSNLEKAVNAVRKSIYRNYLFLEEDQAESFLEIYKLLNQQLISYEKVSTENRLDLLNDDDFKRTALILKKIIDIGNLIRVHLKSLEIINKG